MVLTTEGKKVGERHLRRMWAQLAGAMRCTLCPPAAGSLSRAAPRSEASEGEAAAEGLPWRGQSACKEPTRCARNAFPNSSLECHGLTHFLDDAKRRSRQLHRCGQEQHRVGSDGAGERGKERDVDGADCREESDPKCRGCAPCGKRERGRKEIQQATNCVGEGAPPQCKRGC
eukprot:scaffold7602_cov123-Isochrysis_galbana.AAC.8